LSVLARAFGREARYIRLAVLLAVLAMAAAVGWFRLAQPFVAAAIPPAPASPAASAQRLQTHVTTLSTAFAGRSHDNLAQLEGAAAYVEAQLQAAGHLVENQRFRAAGRNYRNLVVKLGPDTQDAVVIGAHYDVFGELPGADDNASGVAGLLELARLLKGLPLERRVELVAYANEEPPFFRTAWMGSAVHARSVQAAGKRTALMLSLECIGYFSDAPASQAYPIALLDLLYPTTGDFIALIGFDADGAVSRRVKAAMRSGTSLPVHSINAPRAVTGVDFSDHLNYAAQGAPAMMVTDTAFLRNRAYHTSQDTADRLDYRRMAQVVDAVVAVIRQEAGAGSTSPR